MLSAQRQQVADTGGLLLDALQAGGDVAERGGKSPISARSSVAGSIQKRGMVAVGQHAAGAPDRLRPVARAGAVGRADVQRDAGDDVVGIAIGARDGQEVRRCGEGWEVGHGTAVNPYLSRGCSEVETEKRQAGNDGVQINAATAITDGSRDTLGALPVLIITPRSGGRAT